jgi:GAF domain-containing protein
MRSVTTQQLELIVQTAGRAIPSPAGALFLIDRPNSTLTFEVVFGRDTATLPRPLPLDRGIAGMVALSGQPVAIADARQDSHHTRDLAEQIGYLPRTILAVPVAAANGTILGVLELFDRQGLSTFGLDDMSLLGMFAQHIALALEQRRPSDAASFIDRRTAALADQLTAIAEGGDAEYRLCQSVLAALAVYVNDTGTRS